MIRVTLRLLLTSLVSLSVATAQRGPGRAPDELNLVQIECLTLPSLETSKARLVAHYRIPRRFFVFVRPEPVMPSAPFVAHAEIAIEVLDSAGRSVARDYSMRELTTASPQAGAEGSEVGQSSFLVPPGQYNLYVEIRDRESNRIARSTVPEHVPDVALEGGFVSGPLFCAPPSSPDSAEVRPLNFGGDIPLGMKAEAWFLLASGQPLTACTVEYRIVRSPSETVDSALVRSDTIPALTLRPARALVRAEKDTLIRYTESGDSLPGWYRLRLPLALDTLVPAGYTLSVTVRAAGNAWHASARFAIRWFEMPLSLRYLESAIEPMEYLLDVDEYKKLRRSDIGTRRSYFDAYWRVRDNTPGTAYNEVQAEFYRRVDYARRTFNTLKTENGAKTERGKAYILYGPPTKIDRMLLTSSAPQEIWYYPALERKLTFVDRGKSGDYTLIATERL